MPNPFEQRFKQMEAKLQSTLATLPAMAGAIVVEHSDQAFVQQGWTDRTLEPWTPRQSEDAKSQGRAILVLTGRLRSSIRVVSTTHDSVTIGTNVPYAKVHNEGFEGAVNISGHVRIKPITGQKGSFTVKQTKVAAHTKNMRITQRRFLGNSYEQTEKIKKLFTKQIMAALAA